MKGNYEKLLTPLSYYPKKLRLKDFYEFSTKDSLTTRLNLQ